MGCQLADTQVPLLLPDDVLLPFFIRLGYTNLQDRLTDGMWLKVIYIATQNWKTAWFDKP